MLGEWPAEKRPEVVWRGQRVDASFGQAVEVPDRGVGRRAEGFDVFVGPALRCRSLFVGRHGLIVRVGGLSVRRPSDTPGVANP